MPRWPFICTPISDVPPLRSLRPSFEWCLSCGMHIRRGGLSYLTCKQCTHRNYRASKRAPNSTLRKAVRLSNGKVKYTVHGVRQDRQNNSDIWYVYIVKKNRASRSSLRQKARARKERADDGRSFSDLGRLLQRFSSIRILEDKPPLTLHVRIHVERSRYLLFSVVVHPI